MDPFATLGIEPRFQLDIKDVEKRHRDLSRALHPDRYVGRPASERRLALSRAIEVNEAWRALRDPIRRAEALLKRANVDPSESGATATDPELLMEMMEQREALAETRTERNAERLASLTGDMERRQDRLLTALADALDRPAPDETHGALPLLAELRFVRRFLEEASTVEDELS